MDNDPVLALKRQLGAAIVELAHAVPLLVAAQRLGIDRARMSDLRNGHVHRFTLDRLVRMLNTVDRTVTMEVVPTRPGRIEWAPKLLEWRKNHPLTRLRMVQADRGRRENREIERRLFSGRLTDSEARRLAAELDEELEDDMDGPSAPGPPRGAASRSFDASDE